MLDLTFFVFAVAGVIEAGALIGHAASGDRAANDTVTFDGANNETANFISKSNMPPSN